MQRDLAPYFQAKVAEMKGHPAVSEVRGTALLRLLSSFPREAVPR